MFGSKTVFLGQEVHYCMVYIAYCTELNLQICDYAQKRRVCRKHCKYALDENFHSHFPPDERLPGSTTLAVGDGDGDGDLTRSRLLWKGTTAAGWRRRCSEKLALGGKTQLFFISSFLRHLRDSPLNFNYKGQSMPQVCHVCSSSAQGY